MVEVPVSLNYARLKEADAEGYFFKVLEGSSGSAKTFSIVQYLIEKALTKKRRIVACRFDRATCDESIINDFIKVMIEHFGIWDDKAWNKSKYKYTFVNGSTFVFKGCQKPMKLHGPRQDIFWFNEVMEVGFEAFRQASLRTSEEMIIDFNPSLVFHWVFDAVGKRDNCKWIHSTFRDNPFLPVEDRNEILSKDPSNPDNVRQGTADEWGWQVYGLGLRGQREGAIFKVAQYEVVDVWPDKMMCQRHGYGLDFGFSDDPAALVECALFQNQLWLREVVYEHGLLVSKSIHSPNVPSIQGRMEEAGFSKRAKVVADCARPDDIAALVAEGYNVSACKKGAGSIVSGLALMKRFPIKIARASTNLQIEVQQYAWRRHADGSWLDEPEDKWNHAIDAARYWVMEELPGLSFDKRDGALARRARKAKRY